MIAAANAFSDIYAMGGKPVMALNLIGFPNQSLPLSIMEAILKGGADKAAEVGVTIVGGAFHHRLFSQIRPCCYRLPGHQKHDYKTRR